MGGPISMALSKLAITPAKKPFHPKPKIARMTVTNKIKEETL
jgi:hypothetical protein